MLLFPVDRTKVNQFMNTLNSTLAERNNDKYEHYGLTGRDIDGEPCPILKQESNRGPLNSAQTSTYTVLRKVSLQ